MNMEKMLIDSFAGAGGVSLGIKLALGISVHVAINHDPEALAMHWMNHPSSRHLCENMWDVDPAEAVGGKPVGLAWFSPDCTHHSKAKGGKPVKKEIRGLAWVVIKWVRSVRPRVIILENVEEFQDWGPLDENNRPCVKRKGKTFDLFIRSLRRYGYAVEWKELTACDYGIPTTRKRLFLIARCDGRPIVWPEPTHGPGLKPYRTAAECIDWSLPCPSIFLTKSDVKKMGLNCRRPLAEETMKRIAKGVMRYVINADDPFIVPTKCRTDNRSVLIAPFLSQYHGITGNEDRCYSVKNPILTIDTSNRYAIVSSFLTKFYSTNIGSDLREPMPTITASGQHIGQVMAFLLKYYGTNIGSSLNKPMHTVTTKDRFGLVMVEGTPYQIADIGLRMLTPRELARAMGFPDDYILTGSKTNQVAKIGNAVPPGMAKAIVGANVKPEEFMKTAG
jgi:DNA (cytosine-5)-methyltransferase 1